MIPITRATHPELYRDWRTCLEFCRSLPDPAPSDPTVFHLYWRERGPSRYLRFVSRARPFGRKQALPVKAFLATQDPGTCRLWLWSDVDLSDNPWVRPFLDRIELKIYDPAREARGTEIEELPRLYRQRDWRGYRDSDLFRILALHNHGGVYLDADMVLLRSLGVLLDQEFAYEWGDAADRHNNALMHLRKGSRFAKKLIEGVREIKAGGIGGLGWGRENLDRAARGGETITIFPCAFFDTDWLADTDHESFRRLPTSAELYPGAFAWHWHNRWDDAIEPGCKFSLFETEIDRRLAERDAHLVASA